MYIVVEYLLIENFIINLLIFYLTKVVVKSDVKMKKIIIGSALASLYSLVFFFPKTIFLTRPLFKLLFSVLFIRIIFDYVNLKVFMKELIAFYIISFLFAGATIGVFYSFSNAMGRWNIKIDALNEFPIKYLIAGVLISLIGGKLIFEYYHQKIIRDKFIATVSISFKEQKVKIKALLDTGNSLVAPITNEKVIVVEYEKLRPILPLLVKELIDANEENNYKLAEKLLEELKKEIRLRMIPFNSIGKSGIIFGFTPDYIGISYMGKEYIRKDIIIGIFSGSLENEMRYSGLMHYELINGGVEHEYVEVQD